MGRTNGKLVNFLKDGLVTGKYINLGFDPLNTTVFILYLPRYERNMETEYEAILQDWFAVNNKVYLNYSNGKAVLKAAMKKSPYLISLGNIDKRLLFHFSSPQEIEEKRKQQKKKKKELYKNVSNNDMLPPSVSSGYSSGHDVSDSSPEPFEAHDQLKNSDSDAVVDALLPNIGGCELLKDVFISEPPDQNMEINADQTLAKDGSGSNFGTLDDKLEFEQFCNNFIDDPFNLPELLNEARSMTPDQTPYAEYDSTISFQNGPSL